MPHTPQYYAEKIKDRAFQLEVHQFVENHRELDQCHRRSYPILTQPNHQSGHRNQKYSQKKLEISNIDILKTYDLGRLEVDNGLTPNHPGIFAVVIDGNKFRHESTSSKVDIIPIEQLEQYLSKVDDSFFLAIISRLLTKKVISL